MHAYIFKYASAPTKLHLKTKLPIYKCEVMPCAWHTSVPFSPRITLKFFLKQWFKQDYTPIQLFGKDRMFMARDEQEIVFPSFKLL